MNPISKNNEFVRISKHSKGFVTYDTLFSMLVLALMIFEIMYTVNSTIHKADVYKKEQKILNNLVIAGDYVVNKCVVKTGMTSEDLSHPGEIDILSLPTCTSKLKRAFGFNHLSIGFSKVPNEDCIYRIVLFNNEPKLLYVCGD